MSESLIKEITRVNMRNIIVGCILAVWTTAFVYGIFYRGDINAVQEEALSKLDTLMMVIVGYYLKQSVNGDEIKSHEEYKLDK